MVARRWWPNHLGCFRPTSRFKAILNIKFWAYNTTIPELRFALVYPRFYGVSVDLQLPVCTTVLNLVQLNTHTVQYTVSL
jgi:hypothetical protein